MAATYKHIIQGLIAVIMLALFGNVALSDDSAPYLPLIPKAEGGVCVAPPEDIRKNHMTYLKHDRDLRVQKGARDIEHSLKDCISCHVVRSDAGTPVSYESPEHFCRSCHDYAAVKIDCFSCHNSKPDGDALHSLSNPHTNKVIAQQSWLKEWPKGLSDE